MCFFFCKAGLEIGEMILSVNKDSLLGSNYDTVNIVCLLLYLFVCCFSLFLCFFFLNFVTTVGFL